jgi:hypothetical protein
MLKTPVMLTIWTDVAPQARDECDRWYVQRHIAERLCVPGWMRARRYKSATPDTHPDTLALYEVASVDDMLSDSYLALQRNVDAQDQRMRAAFRNVARATLQLTHSIGPGDGGVIVSVRFCAPQDAQARVAARDLLVERVMPHLAALTGVTGVHLLTASQELRAHLDLHRKSGADDAEVDWVLLLEATEEDRAGAACCHMLRDKTAAEVGLADGVLGTYRLMYSATNAAPIGQGDRT